ncbi:radical SAM protein [candidate division KSB1 bacterium]|nr:radical SAM protein [candidate division KSB1 bacterium]
MTIDYLKIIPSYRCNKACSYCYNQVLSQQSNAKPSKLFATLEMILDTQDTNFVAEVLGGEPLQSETIETTISVLEMLTHSLHCRKRVLSTAIAKISTLQRVLNLLDFLYLSIDISPSVINRKQISKHQLENINLKLSNTGVDLCLSVVLYGTEKEYDLEEFVLFIKNIGIKNICFGYIGFKDLSLSEVMSYSRLFYFLFILKYAFSDEIFLGGRVLETLDLAVQRIKRQKICHCGETSLVIQPDGSVSPSICVEYNSVHNYSIARYIKMKSERFNVLKDSSCGRCELWSVCHGGCMGESIALYRNHIIQDKVYCSILSKTWRQIKKDIESKKNIYKNKSVKHHLLSFTY